MIDSSDPALYHAEMWPDIAGDNMRFMDDQNKLTDWIDEQYSLAQEKPNRYCPPGYVDLVRGCYVNTDDPEVFHDFDEWGNVENLAQTEPRK
jgi:hypothetical protein